MYRMPYNSLRQNSTPIQKIKRKYYNIFRRPRQEHFFIFFYFIYLIMQKFSLHKLSVFFYNHFIKRGEIRATAFKTACFAVKIDDICVGNRIGCTGGIGVYVVQNVPTEQTANILFDNNYARRPKCKTGTNAARK